MSDRRGYLARLVDDVGGRRGHAARAPRRIVWGPTRPALRDDEISADPPPPADPWVTRRPEAPTGSPVARTPLRVVPEPRLAAPSRPDAPVLLPEPAPQVPIRAADPPTVRTSPARVVEQVARSHPPEMEPAGETAHAGQKLTALRPVPPAAAVALTRLSALSTHIPATPVEQHPAPPAPPPTPAPPRTPAPPPARAPLERPDPRPRAERPSAVVASAARARGGERPHPEPRVHIGSIEVTIAPPPAPAPVAPPRPAAAPPPAPAPAARLSRPLAGYGFGQG